jgi:hypothetical protein
MIKYLLTELVCDNTFVVDEEDLHRFRYNGKKKYCIVEHDKLHEIIEKLNKLEIGRPHIEH